MTEIARKLQTGMAATAIAAAAVALAPLPTAQAQSTTPTPTAALGNSLCLIGIGEDCEAQEGTSFGGLAYFGPRDTTPPDRSDILVLYPVVPLSLIPIIGPPLAGWFASLNLEVCAAGLSARIGPYGTVTASIGRGC